MRLKALLRDISNMIPKTEIFFKFIDIDDATSDFVFDHFLAKLLQNC